MNVPSFASLVYFNTLAVNNINMARLRVTMLNTTQRTGMLEWRVYGTVVGGGGGGNGSRLLRKQVQLPHPGPH